jgi:selenide,water dikinase
VSPGPDSVVLRMTQLAPGGGCSCKIPADELEALIGSAYDQQSDLSTSVIGGVELLCGLDSGDDATVVRISADTAIVTTTDFFPPVVDNPFDWGRIAAANALSDVYAMGGEPISALNLLAWPADRLPYELAAEVLRGGRSIADEAGCFLAGGHSIQDATPLYGLAVTGLADPSRILRNDLARPGDPISLTKPLGVGLLNNRHKTTGECFPEAVASMAALNRDASRAALAAKVNAATDVTGFGLLGHLYKMARASGVTAVVDASAVPYLEGARAALMAGYVPGGTLRNLAWVRPHMSSYLEESELVLLADAQTSGGLLVAGELPGFPVIGEFVEQTSYPLLVR